MGWFLFGNTKKSRKRKGAASKGKRKLPWLAMARMILALALLGGFAAGWFFGYRFLAEQVGAERAVETLTVVLDSPPAWLSDTRRNALTDLLLDGLDPDPLNHDSLQKAAERLANNPWVQSVERLVRKPGGVILVYATYRKPMALVAARDGYHLVDATGHRLPGVYPFEQLRSLGLMAIIGVTAAPPAEGDRWSGRDIDAALKLIELLSAQPFAPQVRAVDVSNHAGRIDDSKPQLRLITERGMIRWGRAPGEEGVYEPDAARKLRMLSEVARETKSRGLIDANGCIVDVFHDTPMIHPPSHLSRTRPTLH